MDNSQGPGFVCIGAQKAGTTWLYENLNQHSDVWMPPVKEFHYFDRVRANEALLGDWDMPHADDIYHRYIKDQFPPNLKKIRWLRQYYRSGLSKQWYWSLFEKKYTMDKLCGDMTPGYSTLDESGVRYAQKVLNSEIPIIFIIRNPIERSWSAAKMMFRYFNKEYSRSDYAEILGLLKKPHITLCSDYANIIRRWQQYFQHVHVLTYDKLCTSPSVFLEDVSQILDIRNQWDDSVITKRVWSDVNNISIPVSIHEFLKEQYHHKIEDIYSLTKIPEVRQWITATGSGE